jgi:hypothetical protein
VEPIEAQTISDLPIVVARGAHWGTNYQTDLPIAVEPIEATSQQLSVICPLCAKAMSL